MAFNYRGRRVAYDNIAVGSVAGKENTLSMSSNTPGMTSSVTDVSIYNVQEVSQMGNYPFEQGSITNIAVGERPGIEDTENAAGDKFTSEGETITNTPSID